MSQLGQRVCHSKYLSRGTKVEVFKRLVLPVLLYGCETWTLKEALKRRLDSFGTSSLRKILGYRWYEFMSNDRLLEETSMKNISELVFERRMSMFGHAARLSPNDPAHRILSCGNPPGWKRGRGRPPNQCCHLGGTKAPPKKIFVKLRTPEKSSSFCKKFYCLVVM